MISLAGKIDTGCFFDMMVDVAVMMDLWCVHAGLIQKHAVVMSQVEDSYGVTQTVV